MYLWIANALPIVFTTKPLVDDVALDLLHLGVLPAIFLELAVPVHDERVAFLVQPQDAFQAGRDDGIVL